MGHSPEDGAPAGNDADVGGTMVDPDPEQQHPNEPVELQVDKSRAHGPSAGPEQMAADRAHQVLARLLRAAYPHDTFPDGPYERTATAVQEAASADAGDQRTLSVGLAGLDRAAGGDFLGLDDEAAEAVLRDRGDDYFFRMIRSTAVVALYDDQEVWGVLGYEGASYEQGGYLHRGFDDLDWLPTARIEEHDGEPRTELVTTEGGQG
ncbi:MAG: hypothetical protein ACR2FV_12160 [Ornithinimicrobium sp.]|uniref:hypothetical protein n=1 Tax=Ornithinimicrobium sp. TaxID=1977084 RepID=UPI003D9BF840